MAAVQAEIKRGALRSIYRAAQAAGPQPLSEALDAFQDNGWQSMASGREVISHSSAGKTVVFSTPAIWQAFGQDEWFSLTEELQAVYADARVTLSANGNASPTDEQIFNVMMSDSRLQTITSVYNDFSGLRFPA